MKPTRSMGGFATWDIIQRDGDKFAAAMPVCGGGGATVRLAQALADRRACALSVREKNRVR